MNRYRNQQIYKKKNKITGKKKNSEKIVLTFCSFIKNREKVENRKKHGYKYVNVNNTEI